MWNKYAYNILIVEPDRDWSIPMKSELEKLASGRLGINITIADNTQEFISHLVQLPYHVVSFSDRIPERKGELLSSDPRVTLARNQSLSGYPKQIKYANFKNFDATKIEPFQDLCDVYLKPNPSLTSLDVPLSIEGWAKVVLEYLITDNFKFIPEGFNDERLTVMGAYFKYGTQRLPPNLAKPLNNLMNHWDTQTIDRVNFGKSFIEETCKMTLIQSAMLYKAQGEILDYTKSENLEEGINALGVAQKQLKNWNWSGYLTEQVLQSLHPNDSDNLRNDSQGQWIQLRPSLQNAMDLASYWIYHPLATNLRNSRDGYSGKLLMGQQELNQELLPFFYVNSTNVKATDVWQNVWYIQNRNEPIKKEILWETMPI